MSRSLSLTKPSYWPQQLRPLWLLRQRRDLQARKQWETSVCWFRLRYLEGERATKALQLLSRPQQCERVALQFVPGELSKQTLSYLYIGVAPEHIVKLQQIGSDFGMMLELADAQALPQAQVGHLQKMVSVTDLSWWQTCHLHIVDGQPFMQTVTLADEGSYFPQPGSKAATNPAWQLPAQPPVGITTVPQWRAVELPEASFSAETNGSRWPLGWTSNGRLIEQYGAVNLYGQRDAAAAWLVAQLSHLLAASPKRLIVLDGLGDVVPQLKRKTIVTQQLGKQLTYIDIDGPTFSTGCNPLAPLPHETEEALVARWQQWFSGMQLPADYLPLLTQAHAAGVNDLPTLQRWLTQQERQGNIAAIRALKLLLTRLTADRTLREWLAWPTSPFAQLPEGVLLFSCRATEQEGDDTQWGRAQLLRMLYLAAVACPQTQLVLIGMPWRSLSLTARATSMLICNGPLLSQGTVVLTACQTPGRQRLIQKFLSADSWLVEQFALLQHGDALVRLQNSFYGVQWIREKGYPHPVDK